MEPIDTQTNRPALTPRDEQFLQAWLDDQALRGVCAAELAHWAAQPHIAPLLKSIHDLASRRADAHLADARIEAIAALRRVIRTAQQPEVIRRAADRLVRLRPLTTPTTTRTPTSTSTAANTTASPRCAMSPPRTPPPQHPPPPLELPLDLLASALPPPSPRSPHHQAILRLRSRAGAPAFAPT